MAALLDGEPGAWLRVLGTTAHRMLFIAPGLYLTGIRGRQLVASTVGASASVTALMIAYYHLRERS